LIAHQRVRESRYCQEALEKTLEERLRLAYLRYRGGVDTQLNALGADRDLFQSQIDLSRLRLQEPSSNFIKRWAGAGNYDVFVP
jgi:outer membrane protein TolC